MKRIWIVCGLYACLPGLALAEAVCPPSVEEARQLLDEGEATSAIERLGDVASQTDLPEECQQSMLFVLAEAQERLGLYSEAAGHWRKLVAGKLEADRKIDALRGLARIERKLRNLSASLQALRQIQELDPEALDVALDQVETSQAMGDELGAARILLQLREEHPGSIEFGEYRRFELVETATDYLEKLFQAGQCTFFEKTELSRLYQEKGQLATATTLAQTLEKESPNLAEIQSLLGGLFLAQGNLDVALEHYEHALDLDKSSDNLAVLESLGEVFFQRAEKEKAIKIWSRVIHAGTPQEPFEQLELARIYSEHGLYDEAQALLMQLREHGSDSLPLHLYVRQLADTDYITGHPEKALADYLELVQKDPEQMEFIEADLQRMLGDDLDLCESLAKMKAADDNWPAHLFLARGLEFCGADRESTMHYLKAFLLRNQLASIATMFTSLVRAGKFEEASWLEQALGQHDVPNVHLIFYRARLAEEQKQYSEAEKLYAEYLKPMSTTQRRTNNRGLEDDAMYHQAVLLSGPLKKPSEASKLLTELIVRFPYSGLRPEAEAQLGIALYRQGLKDEALRELDALAPTNPIAMAWLGELYLAEGDLEKARVQLRRAMADYPDRTGSQPQLLSLLQIVTLGAASEEETALAVSYHKAMLLEDWVSAEGALRQMASSEALKDFGLLERAKLDERLGRLDEAKTLYDSMIGSGKPEWMSVDAALALDNLYLQAGKLASSIAILEKAILNSPSSPRLEELRGRLVDRKASAAASRS